MDSNVALVLTHNNLDLTKECVESLRGQDIPVSVLIFDNGSTDGTPEWALNEGMIFFASPINVGFSRGMNLGLNAAFRSGADYVLCPGSDTVMPPSYYRTLLELDLPVVSGVQDIEGHRVRKEDLERPFPVQPIRPNPDFSCLLWRKEAWERLGGFDASMVNYASDCDMHLRAHRLGLKMYHAQVPFFHYGSSTLRNAPAKERKELEMQADADRLAFAEKWEFTVGSPEYNAAFDESFFGVDAL